VKRILPLLLVCALVVTLTACKQGGTAEQERASSPAGSKAGASSAETAVTAGGFGKPGELYPVLKGGKYGYIDHSGKIVIEPQFFMGTRFAEDLAMVMVTGKDKRHKCGFIDKQGNMVIEAKFDGGAPFSEGLATVRVGRKAGVINKKGEIVIEPKFERVSRFHDGLAAAVIVRETRGLTASDGGYIDTKGNFVIYPQFDPNLTSFSEGVAGVRRVGQLWSFMDRNEKVILQPKFFMVGQMSEGIAAFMDGASKWGYVDKTGKVLIEPKFVRAAMFSEGLAAVLPQTGKKWGYVDVKGTIQIKEQFDAADIFRDGIAMVQVGEKIGYIDKTGNYVWPLTE
jgi:hypothetical protein